MKGNRMTAEGDIGSGGVWNPTRHTRCPPTILRDLLDRLRGTADDPDCDFNGEVARPCDRRRGLGNPGGWSWPNAEPFVTGADDLGIMSGFTSHGPIPLREVLVYVTSANASAAGSASRCSASDYSSVAVRRQEKRC